MLQNIFKVLVGGETKYLNCSIYLFQRKQWKNSKYPEDKAQSEFGKFFHKLPLKQSHKNTVNNKDNISKITVCGRV